MIQPLLAPSTSLGAPLSSDRAAHVGFGACITEPFRHRVYINCLPKLMGSGNTADVDKDWAVTPADATTGQVRILSADDHAIEVLPAVTLLGAVGYQGVKVANAAGAFEAAKQPAYDLISMDVRMPLMDGLDATRRIRTTGGWSGSVPTVARAANSSTREHDSCLNAGIRDFVSELFDADGFFAVVGGGLRIAFLTSETTSHARNIGRRDRNHSAYSNA